jgi:predicted ATPase
MAQMSPLRQCGDGSRPNAVLVILASSESGIGKSQIAQAALERLGDEPQASLHYFCSPHHGDSALYPIISW